MRSQYENPVFLRHAAKNGYNPFFVNSMTTVPVSPGWESFMRRIVLLAASNPALGVFLLACASGLCDGFSPTRSVSEDKKQPVPEGDWPCWRGPHFDGVSRETGLL